MSVRFAWPVCHRPAGDYEVVSDAVCPGRPFRQPLMRPDANDFSDGLELWLKAGTEAVPLFACFAGRLSFHTATGTQAASLRLWPDAAVVAQLRHLNMLEPLPQVLIYANVDRAAVRQALINLITDTYSKATGAKKTWHPVIRVFIWKKKPLKPQLDPPATRSGIVEQVVDHCLNNSSANPNARLPILAGDVIGEPATAFGGATPKADCPFASDTTPPRHFVFKVEERCSQVRSPLYDLWTWLNNARQGVPVIELLAPLNVNKHPIVKVTNLELDKTKPSARAETESPLRPIPMLELANLHHRNSKPSARVEWRLTDDGNLTAQLLAGQPGPLPNLNPQTSHNGLVQEMYFKPPGLDYGNHIQDMATYFQVPCELTMAFLGTETEISDGQRVRRVRFEPVADIKRRRIDRAVPGFNNPGSEYNQLVNRYTTVRPWELRSSSPLTLAPDPWNDATQIWNRGVTILTWGQMARLLDISPYFRSRISPGLMQTLVNVAIEVTNFVESVYLDIISVDPTAPTPIPSWWDYFNVAQPPARNRAGDFLRDWLLVPRHSILAGMGHIRGQYNNPKVGATCWDPPKVAAAYNHGSLANPCKLSEPPPPTPDIRRTWGLCFNADYMERFGPMYNAAVNLLNDVYLMLGQRTPTVRLRR